MLLARVVNAGRDSRGPGIGDDTAHGAGAYRRRTKQEPPLSPDRAGTSPAPGPRSRPLSPLSSSSPEARAAGCLAPSSVRRADGRPLHVSQLEPGQSKSEPQYGAPVNSTPTGRRQCAPPAPVVLLGAGLVQAAVACLVAVRARIVDHTKLHFRRYEALRGYR